MNNKKFNLIWSLINAVLFGYVFFLVLYSGFGKWVFVLFAIFFLSSTIQLYFKYSDIITKKNND